MDFANFAVANNAAFNITVDGTSNMTSTYRAPVFVSMGNFYGISQDAEVVSSMPLDSQGAVISGDATTGSSWYVTEEFSGQTMQFQSSLQTNLQIFNDDVYFIENSSIYGTFVPQCWVLKTMTLSPSTLSGLLGYQGSIRTTEWVLFGLCLGVGLVTLGVGVMVLLKFMKAKKLEEATSN